MVNYNTSHLNKGAMFGLDARIALAIFGALSVISGAALYSAIQNAKVITIITEVNEIAKATEAYLLDTGVYPLSEVGKATLKTVDLLRDSGVAGWNGPYLNYKAVANSVIHPKHGSIYIQRVKNTDWSGFGTSSIKCSKLESVYCSIGVMFTDVDISLIRSLEEKIDNNKTKDVNNYTGKFRYNNKEFLYLATSYDKKQAID